MVTENDITIILLAGGKSSRMGQDKGLMMLGENRMIEHIIQTAKEISQSIVIITQNDVYAQLGYPIYPDLLLDKGPLGGIYTGLKNSSTEYNLVLSCDIPFLQKELLQFILTESIGSAITVPVYQEKIHPLIGVYTKKCTETIANQIALNQLKVTDVFDKVATKRIDANSFDSSNFRNINSPQDLNE